MGLDASRFLRDEEAAEADPSARAAAAKFNLGGVGGGGPWTMMSQMILSVVITCRRHATGTMSAVMMAFAAERQNLMP